MKQPHGMVMMPMPFPSPPQAGTRDDILERVPTRVFVAVKFLGDLADYTRSIVAVAESDSQTDVQQFFNPPLQVDQLRARKAACDLLERYFNGSWSPEEWETPKVEKKSNEWDITRCFQCGGAGTVAGVICELCKGTRRLFVTPCDPEGGG